MAGTLFSIPIFFIVFRESLEAAMIVAILLGLVEQIVHLGPHNVERQSTSHEENSKKDGIEISSRERFSDENVVQQQNRSLIRKMRFQGCSSLNATHCIFLGSLVGFIIAAAIGATFVAIWFTKASNLYQKSEELWEGTFRLIASILIFVMGITMLKLDGAKTKWRIKLQQSFEEQNRTGTARTGKWALFTLPFVIVLREGLEAVVFVGGVSLGQSAKSIPIAAIAGIICGLSCGFIIYTFASRSTLSVFLVVMTNFLLLIGAGLFSKAINPTRRMHTTTCVLGIDADDARGDGPGSFDVHGNVWHLDCCNADNYLDGNGWLIFGAITGWTNSATIGTVLSYVFYWIAVIATLVVFKWREGRLRVFGFESAAGKARRLRQAADADVVHEKVPAPEGPGDQISELPR
ncbi:iron permease FTR1 [Russula earlei]|uniref:Iron permease FTR1 n=1 Tax=Russula earlei TaxID=71964 RepID=A0ACC0TZ46_9AGAM|nr:iron permease FTR1 [Russula earlei]